MREAFSDLFICMLSGHDLVNKLRAALAAGASGFLVKPVQQVRLQRVAARFLKTYADKPAPSG